jgi:hypothetical protein
MAIENGTSYCQPEPGVTLLPTKPATNPTLTSPQASTPTTPEAPQPSTTTDPATPALSTLPVTRRPKSNATWPLSDHPEHVHDDVIGHHHPHDAHKVASLKPSEIGHQDPLRMPGLYHVAQFAMVTLASFQVGKYFSRMRLPLISG